MHLRLRAIPVLALLASACGDSGAPAGADSDSTGATGTAGSTGSTGTAASTGEPTTAPTTGGSTGDTGWMPARCFDGWDDLSDMYPDAGDLVDCAGVAGGDRVVRSLLVVDGITIDNNGVDMHPCVEARCDQDYAYVASNNLPHYDFVQTTPNALAEAPSILRIPLAPAPAAGDGADPATLDGCVDAYAQFLDDPDQGLQQEPAGMCLMDQGASGYLRETLASGETVTYARLACLGTTAVTIGGVVTAGPNEAGMPDPFGSPMFFMPEVAGEPYLDDDLGMGAALDLCGGHTGGSMHYHGVNEACFARNADGTPANSYAVASQAWDLQAMLAGPCTEPSGIVGWSLDGYPIAGPCVCTQREGDACTEVKRARSSWVFAGLSAWGEGPGEDTVLGVEGQDCSSDDECCPGGQNCNFRCSSMVVEDEGAAGSAIVSRCALLDYAWCTHRFVDRSTHPGGDDFVYLDRCNGFEGPDGYAYHATASFPYLQACYRGEPSAVAMMMGGGGMDPPQCMPGQTMCCGDDVCDGPETAQNCPADCA